MNFSTGVTGLIPHFRETNHQERRFLSWHTTKQNRKILKIVNFKKKYNSQSKAVS
jgi:hypothetical protein